MRLARLLPGYRSCHFLFWNASFEALSDILCAECADICPVPVHSAGCLSTGTERRLSQGFFWFAAAGRSKAISFFRFSATGREHFIVFVALSCSLPWPVRHGTVGSVSVLCSHDRYTRIGDGRTICFCSAAVRSTR